MSTNKRKANRRSFKNLLPMVFLGTGLLVLGTAAFLLLPKPSQSTAKAPGTSAIPVKVDFPAPDLRLQDLSGNTVSLEDWRGKIILVNNWATWCPPCREEMPVFEAYYQAYKGQDFSLIAIDAGDPAEKVIQFVESYQISFPVWLDPGSESLRAFRNPGLPNSYVIDREGMVRLAWTGAISQEMLEKYVTPLFKEN